MGPEGEHGVHVKVSMRPIQRGSLSEHEAKRCRAVAKGRYWEVWEEDILWWSPDQQRWHPLEAESLPRRRRWLIVETEEGYAANLIWEVDDTFRLPSADERPEVLPEQRI
jgi:hypothetical protein